ncbi:MAG: cellulose synthase/poly-beta-1,6-N-acetylglucosamine synthase-like glycosyltransferase [Pirellulaceae bacterium]
MTSNVLTACISLLLVGHVVGLLLLIRNLRWMRWPVENRKVASPDLPVSIIVPARNEAADVEQCIRSLLEQSHSNLKIVAVNDHSSDETGEILDRIAAEDDRLSIIHNPKLREGWLGKHNAMQTALEQTM